MMIARSDETSRGCLSWASSNRCSKVGAMNVVLTRLRSMRSSASSASNFDCTTTVLPRSWCSAEKKPTAL